MKNNDDHFLIEEDIHGKNKKHSRQERKRLTLKDRSKYKKTDQDKIKKAAPPSGFSARILQITPEGVICEYENQTLLCNLKGGLKKEKTLAKNVISVGDIVLLDQITGKPQIIHIFERVSVLARADNLSRKKQQIIASNIDQVLITCSILEPHLKVPLIDRYIIAAFKGNISPVVVITKMDLLESANEEEFRKAQDAIEDVKTIARSLDIPCIFLSSKTHMGLDDLKKCIEGKTSVFSGQSGVGKSSLINLITEAFQETKPIVSKTQKGSHTTTQAIMLPLNQMKGFCVDTPGIRSFGLWEIDENDIRSYFKEITDAGSMCKYPDCKHLIEPDCNVKIQLEKGKIHPLRFDSYCALIQQIHETHLKR